MNQIKAKVNEFPPFVVSHLIPYFRAKVNSFKGGQLSPFCHKWERLTSDASILQIISGDCIEFLSDPPSQVSHPPNSIPRNHITLVDREIKCLLDKGVIVPCDHEPGEFISPIFTVPKKDGNVRLILNLYHLNMFIKNSHFKMDTIHTILRLVTPNCWMVSLDLKDAYYSVKIHSDFHKYLKFTYHGSLYKYTVFPNGLSTCPRKFTKMMKPPLSHLRLLNHIISGYIDDFYLQGSTYQRCIINVIDSIKLLDDLGLVVHPEKSVLIPQQKITFLGFVIDSIKMIVRLRPVPNVVLLPCRTQMKLSFRFKLGSSTPFETIKHGMAELSSARLLSTAGLAVPHGSSTTWFQTPCFCRAELNA